MASLKKYQPMNSWPVQDAKARFSEFLEASLKNGPQIVTKRGIETAVLVPIAQWRRMHENAPPALKDVLLAREPRLPGGIPVPRRGRLRRRVQSTPEWPRAHFVSSGYQCDI